MRTSPRLCSGLISNSRCCRDASEEGKSGFSGAILGTLAEKIRRSSLPAPGNAVAAQDALAGPWTLFSASKIHQHSDRMASRACISYHKTLNAHSMHVENHFLPQSWLGRLFVIGTEYSGAVARFINLFAIMSVRRCLWLFISQDTGMLEIIFSTASPGLCNLLNAAIKVLWVILLPSSGVNYSLFYTARWLCKHCFKGTDGCYTGIFSVLVVLPWHWCCACTRWCLSGVILKFMLSLPMLLCFSKLCCCEKQHSGPLFILMLCRY